MPVDRGLQSFPGLGARVLAAMRGRKDADGRRLTQVKLGELAGISRQTLGMLVNSEQATIKTVRAVARVLEVPADALLVGGEEQWEPSPDEEVRPSALGETLEDFLANIDRIVLTLRNFPGGEVGQKLKVAFLNNVEDIARETGNRLPMEYYALRKQVQDGEL